MKNSSRSRSARILKRVSELFDVSIHCIVRNHFMYTNRSQFFMTGIMIENTPYKDTIYCWSLIVPMYHPGPNIPLAFGQRIGQSNYIEGSVDVMADEIFTLVSSDPLLRQSLFKPVNPVDFVASQSILIDYPKNFPANSVFDVAVGAALARNPKLAFELLQHVRIREADRSSSIARDRADALSEAIAQGKKSPSPEHLIGIWCGQPLFVSTTS